jgi:hypothetical protein
MEKEKLTKLKDLLTEFRNGDDIGLGEMEQLEVIDGLISWIDDLVVNYEINHE